MPTPPPRHLARPRRPWRLLLFIFGLTTAILAALVASATLLPQTQPPRPAPWVALPTSPTPGPEQGAISRPATTPRPARIDSATTHTARPSSATTHPTATAPPTT